MHVQLDNEFQQVSIKDLNGKYNIEMFMTAVRGRKAFAADKKRMQEHNCKIKRVEDESYTHKDNFKLCRKNE